MFHQLEKVADFQPFIENNLDKIIVVKFSKDDCPPCKKLRKNLEEILQTTEKIIVLEIDIKKSDEFLDFAKSEPFSIQSVPTTFFYENKEIIYQFTGNRTAEQLKDLFATSLNNE